jgi:hypothetical protein
MASLPPGMPPGIPPPGGTGNVGTGIAQASKFGPSSPRLGGPKLPGVGATPGGFTPSPEMPGAGSSGMPAPSPMPMPVPGGGIPGSGVQQQAFQMPPAVGMPPPGGMPGMGGTGIGQGMNAPMGSSAPPPGITPGGAIPAKVPQPMGRGVQRRAFSQGFRQ